MRHLFLTVVYDISCLVYSYNFTSYAISPVKSKACFTNRCFDVFVVLFVIRYFLLSRNRPPFQMVVRQFVVLGWY